MLTSFKERLSEALGRGPSLEERYQQAVIERQREMRKALEREGKLMEVDLTPGEGLFFGDRMGPEDGLNEVVRDKLADAIGLLGEALQEKNRAKLYKANADLRGTRIWGERYQELNMDVPITLSQRDKELLEIQASLIRAFQEQKVGPIPRAERFLSYDALSRRPKEIPPVNIEVEMVCFTVTNALVPLQILREQGKKVGEKRVLNLAKRTIDQVRGLKNAKDRGEHYTTLVKLNMRTEDLMEKASIREK